MTPLFLEPYDVRQRARAQLGLTCQLASNALYVVAWREALVLVAVDSRAPTYVVRRARAALELARADADEAELLYARAIVEYGRTHRRAEALTREQVRLSRQARAA